MPYLVLASILLCLSTSFADTLPRLKPGLWSLQTNAGAMPIGAEYCIDDATQDKMFDRSGDMGACKKPEVEKNGSTYLVTTSCNDNGKVRTVRSKLTFTGDTSFTGSTQVSGMTMESNGQHLGPCKQGQRPGSMVIKGPGGMDFNLDDVQKMMQGLSGGMR